MIAQMNFAWKFFPVSSRLDCNIISILPIEREGGICLHHFSGCIVGKWGRGVGVHIDDFLKCSKRAKSSTIYNQFFSRRLFRVSSSHDFTLFVIPVGFGTVA